MDASPKDEIKARLPITEVVGQYVKLERAGRNLRARCPFHKERTPSFNVSPERGSYYCFGCGEKGDIFSFVEKMEGVDFRGALRILAEKAGVELTPYRGETGPSKDEKERLYEVHEEAVRFFVKVLNEHPEVHTYLVGRGLTKDTIEKWHIGYAPLEWRALTDHLRAAGYTEAECVASGLSIRPEGTGDKGPYDRFRGRIMFPIFDAGNRPIAFSGRFFEKMPGSKEEDPAKYVNSPETPLFRKSHVLYGLHAARGPMRRSDFAILVEGQMDLLMMHQCGYPNAVAASGTALTEDHLRVIAHATKRLVLALDADSAGVRSALRSSALAFKQGFDLRVATFPEGKDPADVGKENPEHLKEAIRSAVSAVEFFLTYTRAHTKDERTFRRTVESEVLPLIAVMGSRMEQAHFIQIVARATGLPEDDIRSEVARIPTVREESVRGDVHEMKEQTPTDPTIQAAALLLLIDGEKAPARLLSLLTQERYEEVENFLREHHDELQFRAESEEYVHESVGNVYARIERDILKEKIEALRRMHREAGQRGDEAEAARAAQELQILIRKQHGI